MIYGEFEKSFPGNAHARHGIPRGQFATTLLGLCQCPLHISTLYHLISLSPSAIEPDVRLTRFVSMTATDGPIDCDAYANHASYNCGGGRAWK